ncbi:MAG: RNA 2',3'-cyclic phosphodiesterase [Clostridiales bacterium]|nr:RNA 2',3'-cyclic phosphodiesterase [Clostridiales bacterium]
MRVFIALELDYITKDRIANIQSDILPYCKSSNYTLKDNLHLTLKFIGQVQKTNIASIKEVMRTTATEISPFIFTLNKLGRFIQRGKSLIWLGSSEKNIKLANLHKVIDEKLALKGYSRDKRSFRAHITICRQADLIISFDRLEKLMQIDSIDITVDKLTLMESQRIDGRLVYIPIFRCPLSG